MWHSLTSLPAQLSAPRAQIAQLGIPADMAPRHDDVRDRVLSSFVDEQLRHFARDRTKSIQLHLDRAIVLRSRRTA